MDKGDGDIKKIFINGKPHFTWVSATANKLDSDIFIDFLSQLEKQTDWKGEVTVDNKSVKLVSITLVSTTIMRLSDFLKDGHMNYNAVEDLILHIGLQMLALHNYNKGVVFLNLDDIIVIDKKFFFLSKLQHVLDMKNNDKEQLILTYPMKFSKEDEMFLAPEVLNGKKVLPFIISMSAGYYSLAKLCVYCLGLAVADSLGPIMGSKMYFFLERCLAKEPGERSFLYL